jgi:hypothetical protein
MNRDLFDRRKLIAQDFRNGMTSKELSSKYGGSGHDYREVLLLEMSDHEYNKICHDRRGGNGKISENRKKICEDTYREESLLSDAKCFRCENCSVRKLYCRIKEDIVRTYYTCDLWKKKPWIKNLPS